MSEKERERETEMVTKEKVREGKRYRVKKRLSKREGNIKIEKGKVR